MMLARVACQVPERVYIYIYIFDVAAPCFVYKSGGNSRSRQ